MEKSSRSKAGIAWRIVLAIIVLDVLTKFAAVAMLPERVPQPVIGEWLRLTLVYNKGAAFGLHLGHDAFTRAVFIVLTLLALGILYKLFREAKQGDTARITAVSLVSAGAVGNLIDRLRWERGVVDFLDIGLVAARWPTFNIADMAVTTGAVSLAYVLWREDVRLRHEASLAAQTSKRAPLGESGSETAV